jgi:hypothetical protein
MPTNPRPEVGRMDAAGAEATHQQEETTAFLEGCRRQAVAESEWRRRLQ